MRDSELFENFPFGLAMLAADGTILRCNAKLEGMLGRPRDRLVGQSLYELMHPADVDPDLNPVTHLAELDSPSDAEWRFIVPGGAIRTLKLTLSRQDDHEAPSVLAVVEDVTEERRREEDRKAATKVLADVLERVTDGFVALDRNWRYIYLNTEGARLLGRTKEQLLGKHIWTEFPDGIGQPFHLAYERAMKEQVPVAFEDYYPPFGRWFENRVYPSPDGLTIYFHDTTERVRARTEVEKLAAKVIDQRKWLEALLGRMPAPLVLIDIEAGRVSFMNEAARTSTGELLRTADRPEMLRTPTYCTDEHGRLLHKDQLPQERAARGEEFEGLLVNWHTRSRVRTLLFSVAILPAMSGQGRTALMTFQDITPVKETEERLHAAMQVREEFLSVAAHELKTPITAMNLQLQCLLRDARAGARAEPAMRRVEALQRVTGRLTKLVDTLLDISRLRSDRLELEPEEFDAAALTREVLVRLKEEMKHAGCAHRLRVDGPVIGKWDRLRLDQILTNLISNAVKYGKGKPVEVAIEDLGERARFTVRDHGIGIATDDQARIFEPFERAASARHYGGLGLGLWIVRQLVERMGGAITVSSVPGKGSTFVVELPRAPAGTSFRLDRVLEHHQ